MTDGSKPSSDWLPYLLPFALFLIVATVGREVDSVYYLSYPIRTILVAGVLIWFWRVGQYPELDLRPSVLGIGAGVLGFYMWVLPEELLSAVPRLSDPEPFDPHGVGASWFAPLIGTRLLGAVLVVPIFEELFLRSFLIRWIDAAEARKEDFREMPLGRFRIYSFLVVVGAMALTHPRWIRGGLFSALMCLLLYREKRMGPLIWAHAVTNLMLMVYSIETGRWSFWY